ncbi:hypothetical protein HPE56_09170 [Maribacter sp. ANRC-HE7]|uniref:Lipoprotein n=1 Tax=Maribacter aquimaris TaxID=2737171 RepID=A0ABR7V208_9FLAO|nr:hypothetical protein [Maribacter aquimaris]MBD0777964.1 hypothetical protein [Maribacter aquimaris]
MKKPVVFLGLLFMFGCAPIVISSRPNYHPPSWFYPNRLEVVRYVYFPEFSIYYDLSAHTYLYLDGGTWVRRKVLPQRYRNIDLSRHRYERIKNYQDGNIQRYHEEHNANRGRSNKNTPKRSK